MSGRGTWSEPPDGQLDLPMMELIHKDHDGYVALCSKSTPRFNVTSIRIRDLRRMLPGFVEQLMTDGYMAVNSMAKPKGGHLRGNDMVRRVQACFSDLDHYKLDMTFEQTYAVLFGMVAAGYVPWPSIVAKSGRGMYLFWCFERPEHYTPTHAELYSRTQDRICALLSRIGADPNARDASRVLRIPGSYHTEAKAHVRYTPTFDADGELVTYQLEDLADQVLRVHLPDEPKRITSTSTSTTSSSRPLPAPTIRPGGEPMPAGSLLDEDLPTRSTRPDLRTPWARYFDLVTIAERRGGITEGYRHAFLWRYAGTLVARGLFGRELFDRVWQMNQAACRPPQSRGEVCAACSKPQYSVLHDGSRRNIRSATIARELGVTAAEAIRWKLTSIMPHGTKRKIRRNTQARRRTRQRRTEARRKALREFIAPFLAKRGNHTTSLRFISDHLAARGIAASHETVRKDLAALGWRIDQHSGRLKPHGLEPPEPTE